MKAVIRLAALLELAKIYARKKCGQYDVCSECQDNEVGCHNRLEAQYLLEHGIKFNNWEHTSLIPPTKEDADQRGRVLAWNSVRKYASTKTWYYVNANPDVFTRWMPLPESPEEVE